MTIATSDIPRILIERIEESHPGPALFSAGETDEWPPEVFDALLNCGVLQPAIRARPRGVRGANGNATRQSW